MSGSNSTQNKAAWMTVAKQNPYEIKEAPMPELREGEVLIKNYAVAINPIDYMIQATGMLVNQYPWITGSDAAGEVVAVAPGVDAAAFKPGDRVIALPDWLETQRSSNAGFQLYFAVHWQRVAKLPASLDFSSGCVLPLGLTTAAQMLYQADTLDLPLPSLDPKPTGQVLFVWGGSTSVGTCAIMLALASGYEVATTAGAHNLEYLKRLGVKYAFDYKKPGVEAEVIAALQGKAYAGAVATLMADQVIGSCAEITQKVGGRQFVATVTPPMAFQADKYPSGVSYGTCFASDLFRTEKGRSIWTKWIPEALASGQLKCLPEPLVVGNGLESIQKGCDQAKTISGRKVVVDLQ